MMDGHQRGFGAHNLLFFPAGHLWCVEFGRQSLGQALIVPADAPVSMPREPLHIKVQDTRDQVRLNGLMEEITAEQAEQPHLWQRASQCYADLISIHLLRQPSTGPQPPKRANAARRLSQAYCKRVVESFSEQTNMADHAAALKVTPTHLTRVCKAETGKTAATLLTERQLYEARSLLIESDLPMREIAGQLGFGSAAYFTRFITQHTGHTPSSLRKKFREARQAE